MKILIIDNGSRYLGFLEKFAADDGTNQTTIIKPDQINAGIEKDFDLVLLSGGKQLSVLGHEDYFRSELALIETTTKPLLGICLGCELIGHAFGCKLTKLTDPEERRWIKLEPLQSDPVTDGLTQSRAYESHRWTVSELSPEIVPLATSKDGYEIIRHRSRPIYGFQFHPEIEPDRTALILNRLAAVKMEAI